MRRKLLHPPLALNGHTTGKVILRFMAKVKVDPESGCWRWTASLDENQYARFWYEGRSRGGHRVSWRIFRGKIRAGSEVDHRPECCFHDCVNPDHLRLLTHTQNSRDGAYRRHNGHAKVDEEEIPI